MAMPFANPGEWRGGGGAVGGGGVGRGILGGLGAAVGWLFIALSEIMIPVNWQ